MTLQQLKYVITVAETGTITEAANRLYVSQPSLTNAIHELEKEMNIVIFNRTNKGITLSKEGDDFLGYARQVLEQAADTVRQGASLYNALDQAKLFPPTMLYMIASGEESGELGSLMDRAAENQESALQHRITLTLSVFEPALVVTMATGVLFIVLSILQPLLQLNNMVG